MKQKPNEPNRCRRCGDSIPDGFSFCTDCRRDIRREAAKRATQARKRRPITLAKPGGA